MKRIVSYCLILCVLMGCLCGCNQTAGDDKQPEGPVDYVSQLKLDMNTDTLKQDVTVKSFIDGDTVHFYVPESVNSSGVLKARFLAVNTPESTGKIEEYGKKASAFTREKLTAATSIIIESDTSVWNPDSTGDRYLVWVWYKTAEMDEYRNLNLEILQNGLAIASSTSNNRYGETCMAALNQAKLEKLNVYSGQSDPDFYYGDAVELTLMELRSNIEAYNGMKVAFNGVITMNNSNTVYVEAYDVQTDMYCGISVYYGFGLSGEGLEILKVGNEVRIVGTVQYYEVGGTYQISDVSYRAMKPDDPNNLQKISEGNKPAYRLTDAETFANGVVTIETDDKTREIPFAQLALGSTVEMHGLLVKEVYTTNNEGSSSNGAMTLTCEVDGIEITVRTEVLRDPNGTLITGDAYQGQVISVKGIVELYNGEYQIKVFTADSIVLYQ